MKKLGLLFFLFLACSHQYPKHWFEPLKTADKEWWEIAPDEAKTGEVILSKRNELGILSNFSHTPFEYRGKRYNSIEGFWQMMLYPENDRDPRFNNKVKWLYRREEVALMTAFQAKKAGELAEENMKALGIDWVSFEGERFTYRSIKPGRHYQLIFEAMLEKYRQNTEVQKILLSTGNLKLRADHIQEKGAPPEWRYEELWMEIRKSYLTIK